MRTVRTWSALTVGLVVVLSLVGAGPAMAHENPNHGTIKVHDDAVVDPPQRNQPHVSCEFWIEGFDMSDAPGHLDFYSIPPTSNPPALVMTAEWTADSGSSEDGFHFLAGPFTLDPGHYRVEAFVASGHPGGHDHFAKTKTFWVNECPDVPPEEPPKQPPPCPPDLDVVARQDGTIHLSWGAVDNATQYRIYRAVAGDDLTSYAFVGGDTTSFTDADVEIGVTYEYMVTAVVDGMESENCEIVEATAIPVFPGLVAAALAVVGSVLAYAGIRRRR